MAVKNHIELSADYFHIYSDTSNKESSHEKENAKDTQTFEDDAMCDRNQEKIILGVKFLLKHVEGEAFYSHSKHILFLTPSTSFTIVDFRDSIIVNKVENDIIRHIDLKLNFKNQVCDVLKSYGVVHKDFNSVVESAIKIDLNSNGNRRKLDDVWNSLLGDDRKNDHFSAIVLSYYFNDVIEKVPGNNIIVLGIGQQPVNLLNHPTRRIIFLRHEKHLPRVSDTISKNPKVLATFQSCSEFVPATSLAAKTFSLHKSPVKREMFNLLKEPYNPDTFHLWNDPKDVESWCSILSKSCEQVDEVPNFVLFRTSIDKYIRELRENPIVYGPLTVRKIFEIREQYLTSFGIHDVFKLKKKKETSHAVAAFPELLQKLEQIDSKDRLELLLKCVLAGNVFDWGAHKVAEKMKDGFGIDDFYETLDNVTLDQEAITSMKAFCGNIDKYRSIVIFPDNAGIDFVLGILPFVREMLKMGKKVLIVANSNPCINDITYPEMTDLLNSLPEKVIKEGLISGRLECAESGQGSPCVDLSTIASEVNEKVTAMGTDLIILEGMGRALHTNFNAEFTCDSLKIAMIKSEWLAKRLNKKMFTSILKYSS